VNLRTARLVLRPFESVDAEAVLAYRNDPTASLFQGWPLPFMESHFALLLEGERRLAETGWLSWCICTATKVIGDIGLRPHGSEHEVGVTLKTEAQGRGYASEALAGLSEHAFKDLGAQRLHAGVNPANGRVIRLFTRAGWRYEATAVQAYWHRDHWDDEAIYELSATAWDRRQADSAPA